MQELDDITLKRAAKGDHHAFRTLYDLYAPFIWRVLYPMAGRDMTTARELLQDTFIRVHQSLRQFKKRSALSTWLYRVAYTTALTYARRPQNRYRFESYTDTLGGNDRTDEFDNRQLVDRVLTTLSVDDRFLLVAREIDGISFDEIAEITGQSSGALRTRLHRLKETIRKSFSQEQYALSEV